MVVLNMVKKLNSCRDIKRAEKVSIIYERMAAEKKVKDKGCVKLKDKIRGRDRKAYLMLEQLDLAVQRETVEDRSAFVKT